MDSRQWRDALRVDLRRQNLPPAYIDRLVEELSDHLLDTQTENPSMDAHNALACLGSTDTIAVAASHEFRRQTFASRHPWLTFVVGPVAFVPLLFVALVGGAVCLLCGLLTGLEWIMGDSLPKFSRATEVLIEYCCVFGFESYVRFIPFAVATWLFCRWGQRSEMRRWALAACSIVALLAGLMVTTTTLGEGPNAQGSWTIGFFFRPNVRQLVQMLAPLAIAGWLLFRLPTSFNKSPGMLPTAD